MEVVRAGEEVRRQQTLCRERCAVGTTAHRRRFWRYTEAFHRGEHQVNSPAVFANGVTDIAVSIADSEFNPGSRVLGGDFLCRFANLLFTAVKAVQIEIANVCLQPCAVLIAMNTVKPYVAFAPGGVLRRLLAVEIAHEVGSH